MKKLITSILILGSLYGTAYALPTARYEQNIYPFQNSVYDLGTSTLKWLNGYFNNLKASTTLTVQGTNFATTTIGDYDNYLQIGAFNYSGGIIPMLKSVIAGTQNVLGVNFGLAIKEDRNANANPVLYFSNDDVTAVGQISMATSTQAFGIQSGATTTANKGIDISEGCFAIAGTCIGGSGGTNYWTYVAPFLLPASSSPVLVRDWPFYSLSDTVGGLFMASLDGSISALMGFSSSTDAVSFSNATGGYNFDDKVNILRSDSKFPTTTVGTASSSMAIGNFNIFGADVPQITPKGTSSGVSFPYGILNGQWFIKETADNPYGGSPTLVFSSDDFSKQSSLSQATSTNAITLTTDLFNISTQASTTSNYGFDISGGCYAIAGVCISGGSTGDHWATSTTDTTAILPSGATKVGIGTSSPQTEFENTGTTTSYSYYGGQRGKQFQMVGRTAVGFPVPVLGPLEPNQTFAFDLSGGFSTVNNSNNGVVWQDNCDGIDIYGNSLPMNCARVGGVRLDKYVEFGSRAFNGATALPVGLSANANLRIYIATTTGLYVGVGGTELPNAMLDVYETRSGERDYLALTDSSWTNGDRKSITWFAGAATAPSTGTPINQITTVYHQDTGDDVDTRFTVFNNGAQKRDVVTISGNGFLGANTTTPSNFVTVDASTTNAGGITLDGNDDPAITLNSVGTTRGYLGVSVDPNSFLTGSVLGDLSLRVNTGGKLHLGEQGYKPVTFSNGKVGIGSTTPMGQLSINGAGTGSTVIGDYSGSSNYQGISFNGQGITPGGYNILSSPSDTNLFINRPSSKQIKFLRNNSNLDMIIDTNGYVGVATSTPFFPFSVSGKTLIDGHLQVGNKSDFSDLDKSIAMFATSTNSYGYIGVQNLSNGPTASADFVWGNDQNATPYTYYADCGLTSSANNDPLYTAFTGGSSFYCYNTDGSMNFAAATTTSNGMFSWTTGSTLLNGRKMVLMNNGNVGIGATTTSNVDTLLTLGTSTSDTYVNGLKIYAKGFSLGDHPVPCITFAGALSTLAPNSTFDSGRLCSGVPGTGSGYGRARLIGQLPTAAGTYFDAFTVGQNNAAANSSVNFGIASSSPWATLAVNPTAGDNNQFVVGSSTATSFIINNAGNIGIGTTTPADKLVIENTGNANNYRMLRLQNYSTGNAAVSGMEINAGANANGGLIYYRGSGYTTDPNSFWINNVQNAPLVFANNNSEKMRINTGGNVGIGTTTPAFKLELAPSSGNGISLGDRTVNGNLYIGRSAANAFGGNSGWINFGEGSSDGINFIAFGGNGSSIGGEMMRLDNGNLGIGTTTPARTLTVTKPNTRGELLLFDGSATVDTVTQGGTYLSSDDGKFNIQGMNSQGSGTASFFTVDQVNARIGIGTTSPISTMLMVTGGTANNSNAVNIAPASSGDELLNIDGVSIQGYVTSAGLGVGRTSSNITFQSDLGGNVLMGTTTGNRRLTTYDTLAQFAISTGAGFPQYWFRNAGGNLYIATTTVAGTATSSISALSIIGSSGFTGIASSTPTGMLSVNGSVWLLPSGITTNTGASTYSLCLSSVGEVTKNSDAETCIASSKRFKKNIETLTDGLSQILKLKPVTFDYKDKSNPGEKIGLIAEDVQKVNPVLISLDEKGLPNGIRWSHVTTLLVQSVQQLNSKLITVIKQVKNHETRLQKLEKENQLLKARLDRLESKLK